MRGPCSDVGATHRPCAATARHGGTLQWPGRPGDGGGSAAARADRAARCHPRASRTTPPAPEPHDATPARRDGCIPPRRATRVLAGSLSGDSCVLAGLQQTPSQGAERTAGPARLPPRGPGPGTGTAQARGRGTGQGPGSTSRVRPARPPTFRVRPGSGNRTGTPGISQRPNAVAERGGRTRRGPPAAAAEGGPRGRRQGLSRARSAPRSTRTGARRW